MTHIDICTWCSQIFSHAILWSKKRNRVGMCWHCHKFCICHIIMQTIFWCKSYGMCGKREKGGLPAHCTVGNAYELCIFSKHMNRNVYSRFNQISFHRAILRRSIGRNVIKKTCKLVLWQSLRKRAKFQNSQFYSRKINKILRYIWKKSSKFRIAQRKSLELCLKIPSKRVSHNFKSQD